MPQGLSRGRSRFGQSQSPFTLAVDGAIRARPETGMAWKSVPQHVDDMASPLSSFNCFVILMLFRYQGFFASFMDSIGAAFAVVSRPSRQHARLLAQQRWPTVFPFGKNHQITAVTIRASRHLAMLRKGKKIFSFCCSCLFLLWQSGYLELQIPNPDPIPRSPATV